MAEIYEKIDENNLRVIVTSEKKKSELFVEKQAILDQIRYWQEKLIEINAKINILN